MTRSNLVNTSRSIQLPEGLIHYHLRRSRRKTIGLRISEDGLQVTAPEWVALAEIERVLHSRGRWIVQHLAAWAERQQQRQQTRTRWEHGGTLPYLGVAVRLHLGGTEPWRYQGNLQHPATGDTLVLGLPRHAAEADVQALTHSWLQRQARQVLEDRLQAALTRTGLSITGWRLSSAKTRWGSCNSQGRIMLSWRLVHLSPFIIDYVIVHELAHLREMNHSPAFWAEVEALMPNYREAREQLRRLDPATLPTF